MRRSHAPALAILALALALPLTACDEQPTSVPTQTQQMTFEGACNIEGLAQPQRQTLIVLDEGSLRQSDTTNFRDNNPGLVEAIVNVADADAAVASGALAPRERVTLLLAPAGGGALQPLFTGCAPALSPAERETLRGRNSTMSQGIDDFFGSGAESDVSRQASEYRTRLLGAVQNAAQRAPAMPGRSEGPVDDMPFVRALKATPRIVDPDAGAPRIFVVAPQWVGSIGAFPSPTEARQAGFAAARRLGLDLGLSEVHLLLSPQPPAPDFLTAFFLGSGGNLRSWSGTTSSTLVPPPAGRWRFSGEVQYGAYRYPLEIRLATDTRNNLVNSWIVMRGENRDSIPVTGTFYCANQTCRLTSDDGGFAQLRSPTPGGDPEFAPTMPFGGLRSVEMTIEGRRGTGRIYDRSVDDIAGRPDIPFTVVQQ